MVIYKSFVKFSQCKNHRILYIDKEDGSVERDFLKDVDLLFQNNKELIDKLADEKRILESLFLDNRIPEDLKKDLLSPYNALVEVIEKRIDIYKTMKQTKQIPNLVGVLHNEVQKKYLISILKNLQELAKRRNINIICFTLENVNINEGLVAGLIVDGSSITQQTVSIPKCTFNLGYYSKVENVNKIKQIHMMYKSIVVNPVNIFNQAVVFDVLSSVQVLKEHILPVSTLSPSIISEYLLNSDTVFLLPEKGVHSNTVVKIEKHSQNRKNNCSIEIGEICQYCSEKNLYLCVKKMIANKRYMVVQGKKALLWNGSLLEARVYVQKGITGKWGITELIAKNEIFIKDSIYKDTADELERILINIIPDKVEEIIQSLENISLNICSYMDYYFLHLGSSTIDFIIDEEGNPFIIGFGGWDQKNYLFKLNGKHIWDKYISNSVDYLLYLKNSECMEET